MGTPPPPPLVSPSPAEVKELRILTELSITQCPPRNPDFFEPDSRQWADENDVHCNLIESDATGACAAGSIPGEGHVRVRRFTPQSLGGPAVLLWNKTTLDLYKGEPFLGTISYLGPDPSKATPLNPFLADTCFKNQNCWSPMCVTVNMMSVPDQEWLTDCKVHTQTGSSACKVHKPDQLCKVHCSIEHCPQTSLPCTCGVLMEFPDRRRQFLGVTWWTHRPQKTNFTSPDTLGVTRWTHKSPRSNLYLRAGRIWEPLWHTQTFAYLGIVPTTLILRWDISRLWIHHFYTNCTRATAPQQSQFLWWLSQTWPKETAGQRFPTVVALPHDRKVLFGENGTGLGNSGHLEQAVLEEKHPLEKVSVAKIEYKVGLLVQEEGRGWNPPTPEGVGLKEWIASTERILQEYASITTWEQACIQTQQGLLDSLIQMGSELTAGQWPTLLNAEAKSHNIFATYGVPHLWKMVLHNCNETSCTLVAHVPRLNGAISYPVVKLMGLGEIIQNTRIVPMGHRWAMLWNKTHWDYISLSECQLKNGIWLCPQQKRDSDFTQAWPLVPTPTKNSVWYMGRGIFCWEGMPNETITLTDFSCEFSKYPLSSAGPWCTVKPIAQLHFTVLNKTYVNHDVEEFSTLPPDVPHEEVALEEMQWPTSELKLADGRLLELLNQTNGLYSVYLVVNSSGNHMISLRDANNESCNGLFGWYSCLLSSSDKSNIIPIFFLTVLSGGFIVALIVSVYLCFRCYLALKACPKEVRCQQVVVHHSGDLPSAKICRGHLVQSTPESVLLLPLPTSPTLSAGSSQSGLRPQVPTAVNVTSETEQ
ncbi:hypothetical protein HispidOSU_016897 [Sigmodon hispidus]